MKKLEVRLTQNKDEERVVGTLAESNHRVYFEYDKDFLQDPIWLSPFKLPPKPGLLEHVDLAFGPMFGLFDDSLPDGWGLLLMDRSLRKTGLSLATITALDRLAFLGSGTMGALTYHPTTNMEQEDIKLMDLHVISKEVEKVYQGSIETILPQLLQAGGSPGGARPKVLVGVRKDEIVSGETLPEGFEHWLIKFISPQENANDGLIEFAYAKMADSAGIDMPLTRLFESSSGQRYFGVKRFDRKNGKRFHVHTFGNMIHSNFRIPSCDYRDLMKITQVLTKKKNDLLNNFRRMVFNVLANNRDDHVKNFAFIYDSEKGWEISPAYDLTFSSGPGGEHSMTVNGEGRFPDKSHLLNLAIDCGIPKNQACSIIEDVTEAVSCWGEFAEEIGLETGTLKDIEKVIQNNIERCLK